MKVRADENVSIKIVQAIRLVCLSSTWELSHVREHHGPRTHDETWLPRFAAEGGKAFVTGDARILARPHQLVAVRDAGLSSIVLSQEWTEAKRHDQAAHLIYWWPKIEEAIKSADPGDCWKVPFKYERSLGLVSKKINYDKPAQAAKK